MIRIYLSGHFQTWLLSCSLRPLFQVNLHQEEQSEQVNINLVRYKQVWSYLCSKTSE